MLTDYVAEPFVRLFRWLDRVERRWTEFLAGRPAEPTPAPKTQPQAEPAEARR